jgi:trk system potassium uptake protein TrkA
VCAVHIVILGCGRVGSLLAHRLDDQGHSVAVVDMDAKAFRRLGETFTGTTVTGIGFDRETLETAGITRAHGFAAVSSGDNTNILSARVARETYGVAHVVARIYDPGRAEVYERLGIPTVATVSWTAGQILRQLLPSGAAPEYVDASGTVMLAEVHIGSPWLGRRASDLERVAPARLGFVTRYGVALLPDANTVLQEGDLVHLLLAPADRSLVESMCEKGPEQ